MKLKKLLTKVETLLSDEKMKASRKRKGLEELIEKLARRERELATELEAERDEERRQKLTRKLKLAKKQRQKGQATLDALPG